MAGAHLGSNSLNTQLLRPPAPQTIDESTATASAPAVLTVKVFPPSKSHMMTCFSVELARNTLFKGAVVPTLHAEGTGVDQ